MSTLKYWVWLSTLTSLKPVRRFALLDAFGDPEKVYYADERLFRETLSLSEGELRFVMDKRLDRTTEILNKCHEENIAVICYQDLAYPQRLKNIFDPPIVLYIRGKLPAVDEAAAIAIVGTRKATPYGVKMAKKLGFEITKGGGLIVTGLASGIDTAAAEGALRAGGSCIGVLGCAIDEVYPRFSDALYADVQLVGAIVSEYPPGEPISKKNFPERNRLISGLSVGVTVIEAPLKSGSLITASLALDQGREVFAVPGNADAPNCFGSNELIREGAQLVVKGWDVLSDFAAQFSGKLCETDAKKACKTAQEGFEDGSFYEDRRTEKKAQEAPETGRDFAKLRVRTDRKRIDNEIKREYIDLREQLSGLTERQLKIVAAMEDKSVYIDDIIGKTELSAPEVLSELTIMQIKGLVSQESGKRFTLKIVKR